MGTDRSRKQVKVTKQWAAERDPCPVATRKFFKRWPGGLMLNRRNLYMVATDFPISYLYWFGYEVLHRKRSTVHDQESWRELNKLAQGRNDGLVISPPKKQAFAKALADALGL